MLGDNNSNSNISGGVKNKLKMVGAAVAAFFTRIVVSFFPPFLSSAQIY